MLVNALRKITPSVQPAKPVSTGKGKIVVASQSDVPLPGESRFVVAKVSRGLAELLNSAGYQVSTFVGEAAPGSRHLTIRTSQLGEKLSFDVDYKGTEGELISSTELNGKLKDLARIYHVLPQAIVYGLDVNISSLEPKKSARRPTNSTLAFAEYIYAGTKLETSSYQEAVAALDRATAADPKFAMAYWALSRVEIRQGNKPAADRYMAQAQQIDPDHQRVPLGSAGDQLHILPDLMNSLRLSNTQITESGVGYLKASSDAFRLSLHVWTFRNDKFGMRVLEQTNVYGTTARDELLRDSKSLLGVNGGYFHSSDKKLSPSGILVADKVIRSRAKNKYTAALVEFNGRTDVIWMKDAKPLESYSMFVQTGPMLVDAQGVNGILETDQSDRANRTAICVKGADIRVIVLTGEDGFGVTLRDLGALLSEKSVNGGLECDRAVNLDGGWSTQAAYRSGAKIMNVGAQRKVQSVLAIRSRST